jgi:histidinol-phosphatase
LTSAGRDQVEPRLGLARRAAREAGRLTLEYFRRDDLKVERKRDDSPVTAADRRAEEHLRERIAAAFPADGIFGEELPERPGTSGYRWILDPLDGTKSFIHGVPLYGTLVAVEYAEESLVGVICIPPLDECVYAAAGLGAWYQQGDGPPRPARVSQRGSLAEGLFVTSEVRSFDRTGRRAAYDRLQQAARLSRSWGDCYGYLMVATGRADVMIDPVVALWDLAALPPIVEEAGGRLTDWEGRRTVRSGECVATNGLIHDEVLAMLRQ